MIKSFSGQVVFFLLSSEPYLLTLAKTDYPSILLVISAHTKQVTSKIYTRIKLHF